MINSCFHDYIYITYVQDLAGVAHDDIYLSVFSSSSDEQNVSGCIIIIIVHACRCNIYMIVLITGL